MKTYFTVLMLLIANLAFSQTMWNNPLPIRQSGNLEWNQSSVTTGGNDIVHVWSEKSFGVGKILVQKFYGDGNSLWGDEPIVVAESYYNQWNAKITTTSDGGYVVAWLEYYNYQTSIRAQKFDFSGNKLWADDGVFISTQYNEDLPHRLVLFPNENGGAIISWIDYDTMAQSLDSNGSIQWGEEGLIVGYTYYNNQVSSDGHGGLIIVDTPEYEDTMSYKRIDATGVVLWSEEISLEIPGNDLSTLKIIYNNIDSYYLITEEYNYPNTEIAVRKISLTGGIDSNVAYIPIMEEQVGLFLLEYTTNANGNLFVVSQSMTNLTDEEYSLLAFNLDQNLDHVWSETGVVLDNFSNYVYNSTTIEATDSGELFISNVQDGIEEPFATDFYVNLYNVNADGSIQTAPSGILIYQAENVFPSLSLNYGDDLFIVWTESVDGYTNLRQDVLNDELQSVMPDASKVVRQTLTGSVYQDKYESFFLADSQSTVFIWLDERNLMNNKIKYQIVDSAGNIELAENGVDLADFTIYGATEYEYDISNFTAAQNESGQICVVWSTEYSVSTRSRIIDSDGSLLGSETGEEIDITSDEVVKMSLTSYNNEFYLSWLGSDYAGTEQAIYGIKTTNSTEWGNPSIIENPTSNYIDLNTTINNYCVVNETDQLYHVFKIAEDGTIAEFNQVLVGYDHQFDCDDDNNLFFTWFDEGKVYAQGISDSNELFWEDPVLVSNHDESEDAVEAFFPEILVTDGLNITWNQSTEDFDEVELRAQKLSFYGEKLWFNSGVLLSSMDDSFNVSLLEEMNDGYFIAGWRENDNGYWRYKLNIINSDGNVSFDGYSSHVAGYFQSNTTVKVTNLLGNNILFTWIYQGGLYAVVNDLISVDNEINDIAPTTINLLQNYPNPFNPETNISFQVPNSGQVRIDIYNIKGQKVKTLVNDRLSAGRHSVVWNGKDDSNKAVASGLYLYKLISGKHNATRKMILMK